MKKYFILAAVALFAACTSDDITGQGPEQNERLPLNIGTAYNAGKTAMTRSTQNDLQSKKIENGTEVGLFVFKEGSTAITTTPSALDYEFFNEQLKYVSVTTISTVDYTDLTPYNTSNKLVYPSDKTQGIDLYAYAPFNSTYAPSGSDIDGSTAANKVTLAIQQNQKTDANYNKSDILWGCVGNGAAGKSIEASPGDGSSYPYGFTGVPGATVNGTNYIAAKGGTTTSGYISSGTTAGSVIIPMLHKASKIVVQLTASGMALDKLEGAKVTVFTPSLSSTLDIATGALDKVSGASPVEVTMTEKLGWKSDETAALTIADVTTAADNDGSKGIIVDDPDPSNLSRKITKYVCSAIIMPQDLAADADLLKIYMRDGKSPAVYNTTYKYSLPNPLPSGLTEFESGKVYTFDITVTASGVSVTTTVQDWVDATSSTPISGNAELQ